MKIISQRDRDISDAHGIMMRRFSQLDFDYLEPRVRELATILAGSDIATRWDQWKGEIHKGNKSEG